MRTIAVGWEYEVPADDVEAAREADRAGLEAYFHTPAELLSGEDIARYLVRTAHPTTRYLRSDVTGLGYSRHSA